MYAVCAGSQKWWVPAYEREQMKGMPEEVVMLRKASQPVCWWHQFMTLPVCTLAAGEGHTANPISHPTSWMLF